MWRLGTFALLAIGVGLAILARAGRSRALGALLSGLARCWRRACGSCAGEFAARARS